METAIQDVMNAILFEDLENIVLVGHSFAGKVVSSVADRMPERIHSLLFLDAFVPANVQTPQGDFGKEGWPTLPDGWRIPLTEEILRSIGKDLQSPDREWMLSKITPWLMRYAGDPITLSGKWNSVKKKAYILCTGGGDDVQEILKRGLDGPSKVIDSGHWPMITKPEETRRAILELS
jgi:pimeloyl-ACP methyl ester carboxylesterase